MRSYLYLDTGKLWIQVSLLMSLSQAPHVSGYRSFVDTGQFGDVTFISSTCIWIQVTCGFRSIS